MVHNGIEYGIMAAYAEGLGVLRDANIGKRQQAIDAETTPLRDPERYQYDLNLREHRRGMAARQCDCFLVAGSDSGCITQRSRTIKVQRARLGLR